MSILAASTGLRAPLLLGACVAGLACGAAAFVYGARAETPAAALAVATSPRADADDGSAPAEPYDRAAVDAAIERGLAWLAAAQEPGGGFVGDTGHKQGDSYEVFYAARSARAAGRSHPGVTGFAGMAFLAAGHVPGRGPYGPAVERAIDCLLAGDPSVEYLTDSETNMYGHAFATLFLAQAEGMARGRDPRILPRLRAAAHLVERCQNEIGGWRYYPFAEECDLSVTVCQTQALRAAKEAGVDVKASTIRRVVEYLRESRIPFGSERGCFYYKITGRGARSKTSFAINAAAAATLQASGVYDESEYDAALAYVDREYPDIRRYYADHFYFWYGNWHAAQAFRMHGGPRFERYFGRLARDLLALQRDDGRWTNRTGPGDAWSTAVACLILSVPYGYLPIFAN